MNISLNENRFEILDITRFLAATGVLVYHYFFRGGAADAMSPLVFPLFSGYAKYGWMGVPLFFMISGFVILMSAQGRTPAEFVISRLARLYPAYWFAVLFTTIIMMLWGGGRYPVSGGQVAVNLSMFQSFFRIPDVDGVYWTLAKEIVFYFWIWLLLVLSKIERFSFWAAIFLFIGTLAIFVKFPGYQLVFLTDYGCYFVAGCAFYLLNKNGFTLDTLALIIWSMVLIAINLKYSTQMYSRYFNVEFSLFTVFMIMGLFYLIFFSIALGMWKKYSSKYAMTLGALTYPLYLLHENIGFIAFTQLSDYINKYILVTCVMISVTLLSYVVVIWVEAPLRPILRRVLAGLK